MRNLISSRLVRMFSAVLSVAALVLPLGSAMSVSPTYAAIPPILLVTTANDENIVNGNCSLREAILAAISGTLLDQCNPINGTNTIFFAVPSVNVNASLPAIPLGTSVTLDPGGFIQGVSTVTINQTTSFSGGIFILSTLSSLHLKNVKFNPNASSTCAYVAGALTLTNTTFTGCTVFGVVGSISIQSSVGGTVDTTSGPVTLNVADSKFSGSTNAYFTFRLGTGGGTITRSSFTDSTGFLVSLNSIGPLNISRTMFAGKGKEAINFYDTTLTLTNSIISSKTVAGIDLGGGFSQNGQATITNSTFISNSNAIAACCSGQGQLVRLRNTILKSTGQDCIGGAKVIDDGNNTQMVGGCATIPVMDPKLDKYIPLPGSPVIDHGAPAWCPPDDYFGAARPIDGDGNGTPICDIGAVEYKP